METQLAVVDVAAFMEAVQKQISDQVRESENRIIKALTPRKIEKGIVNGIAKPLSCSRSFAYTLFQSGIFDEAVTTHDKGRGKGKEQCLFFDVEKVKDIALRENITAKLDRRKNC